MSSTTQPDRGILRHAVFVTGPTSVGKSEIALRLALRHGSEIVNADAFQLYREFPVLSAQPSAQELATVPHHLFGCVPCAEEMDAARFAGLALGAMSDVFARGRVPFVVGGSGLYLQALLQGLPELPSIDPAVRLRVRALPLAEAVAELRRLDPASAAAIDLQNPRRVARRLELCWQTSRLASELLAPPADPSPCRGVVLVRERDDLHRRIAAAVSLRLQNGAIEEVALARSVAGTTARQILGWREITAYLDGQLTFEDCRERLIVSTRQYAKRQLTWFRAKSTFPFINISAVTPDILDRISRESGLS
jgi:tRNA dimethylallyltransferase